MFQEEYWTFLMQTHVDYNSYSLLSFYKKMFNWFAFINILQKFNYLRELNFAWKMAL